MILSIKRSLRSLGRAFLAAPLWVLVSLGLGLAAVFTAWPWLALFPLFLLGFVLFFFRSPWRETEQDTEVLYSSADGVVAKVESLKSEVHPAGEVNQVLIFMSPLNVHRNTAPCQARVSEVRRIKGKFLPAFREGIEDYNERTSIHFGEGRGVVIVTQIAGILARRIVCRAKPGDSYRQGEEFGLIRFGSANELLFNQDWEVMVSPGERVKAGLSVIARRKA